MTARIGWPLDAVKEQFWRRTIADQARSGLCIKAYCQREGLEPRNFHRWRQVLARRDREVLSAHTSS
jgi:transposase